MKVFYVPLDLAQTPSTGWAYCNKYWIVHPQQGVAFCMDDKKYSSCGEFNEPYPQCNSSRNVEIRIRNQLYQECDVLLLPAVYQAHAINKMIEVRRLIEKPIPVLCSLG